MFALIVTMHRSKYAGNLLNIEVTETQNLKSSEANLIVDNVSLTLYIR